MIRPIFPTNSAPTRGTGRRATSLDRLTPSWAALLAVVLLASCAVLPSRELQKSSVTLEDTGSTALAIAADKSLSASDANGFRLLPEPEASLEALLALIQGARRSLDLQYFILNGDQSGVRILAALRDASRSGVRVRLLVDDLNTDRSEALLKGISGEEKVEVRLFNPLPGARSSVGSRVAASIGDISRVQYRMHNKLLVADNSFAILGGRNIGDEYLMRPEGNFLDMDMLVAGPLVREMSESFDDYWNSNQAYTGDLIWGPGHRWARKIAFDTEVKRLGYRNDAAAAGPGALQTQLRAGRVPLHECHARFFADPVEKSVGVSQEDSSATLHERVIELLASAKSDIYVVSPYYVRGIAGLRRLDSSRQRGIRVQVLTNSMASSDEPVAQLVYARHRKTLVELGVELHEFIPASSLPRDSSPKLSAGRLHTKLAVVDHRFLYVGSLNFTNRSERINTEHGVVLDCPVLAQAALDVVERAAAYKVGTQPNGRDLQWVDASVSPPVVWNSEPHVSGWLRLEHFFLNLLIPEGEI